MASSPNADVAIVGGGFIGLSCAYFLAGRGINVVVLERKLPGAGSSARSGSGVRSQLGTATNIQLSVLSEPYWAPGARNVSVEAGREGSTGVGRAVIHRPGASESGPSGRGIPRNRSARNEPQRRAISALSGRRCPPSSGPSESRGDVRHVSTCRRGRWCTRTGGRRLRGPRSPLESEEARCIGCVVEDGDGERVVGRAPEQVQMVAVVRAMGQLMRPFAIW